MVFIEGLIIFILLIVNETLPLLYFTLPLLYFNFS